MIFSPYINPKLLLEPLFSRQFSVFWILAFIVRWITAPRGSFSGSPVFGSCHLLKPGTLCASTRHCRQSLYVEPAGISGVALPICSVTQPQALHSRKYRLDFVIVIFDKSGAIMVTSKRRLGGLDPGLANC